MTAPASEGSRAASAVHHDTLLMAAGRLVGVFRDIELNASVALALLYAALMNGHLNSVDGLIVYRQSLALLFTHSFHFPQPILFNVLSLTTSKYGLGLSLVYLPSLVLWSWLHPYVPVAATSQGYFRLLYDDPLYTAACAPVHILIAAASAYLVGRFLLALGYGHRVALWGLALFGVASPAIVYSRGDWSQPLEGLCWIAALYSATRLQQRGERRHLWWCAAAAGFAEVTRPVEGAILAPFVLALLMFDPFAVGVELTRRRTVTVVLAGIAAGFCVTLLSNAARYGSPLHVGYTAGEGWTTPIGVGLAGSLVSAGRGIPWEFPAALLAPLGVRALWREGNGVLAVVAAGLITAQLINASTWYGWWGGWDWGNRLFVPAFPILAVLSGAGVASLSRTNRRWVPGFLLVAGIVWAVPCLIVDLAGGYGRAYNRTSANFDFVAYPPIGAWRYLHHLSALGPVDRHAVDILWLRAAHATGGASVLMMVVSIGLSALAAQRTRALLQTQHLDPDPP